MAAPVDYKAHELNLYSDDNKCHLFFKDGQMNPQWAPGFGLNQKYHYIRYTQVDDGGYMHPIVVAGLHYLDTNGFVSGVGWSFYEVKNSITQEAKDRDDADRKLTTDLADEKKAREDTDSKLNTDLSDEKKSRVNADDFLQAQIGGLWSGLQTIEADSKTRDSALDIKISFEKSRAESSEAKLQSNIDTEITDRKNAIAGVQSQVDAILQGSSANLNTFIELVNDYNNQLNSVGNTNYIARISYLESIVAQLVNKSI
jgi:hypothetical protein